MKINKIFFISTLMWVNIVCFIILLLWTAIVLPNASMNIDAQQVMEQTLSSKTVEGGRDYLKGYLSLVMGAFTIYRYVVGVILISFVIQFVISSSCLLFIRKKESAKGGQLKGVSPVKQ